MCRKKESEAKRKNWLFCSRKCATIYSNKDREPITYPITNCKNCYESFLNKRKKQYCSLKCSIMYRKKNRTLMNDEIRKKISVAKKGKKLRPLTDEEKMKRSLAYRGEKSHFWKGGITYKNKIERSRVEYSSWRKSVFERDNYTCQFCGARSAKDKSVYLQADHIKPFALFSNLRFSIDNGRTLCIDCHRKTPTFGGRTKHS